MISKLYDGQENKEADTLCPSFNSRHCVPSCMIHTITLSFMCALYVCVHVGMCMRPCVCTCGVWISTSAVSLPPSLPTVTLETDSSLIPKLLSWASQWAPGVLLSPDMASSTQSWGARCALLHLAFTRVLGPQTCAAGNSPTEPSFQLIHRTVYKPELHGYQHVDNSTAQNSISCIKSLENTA